MANMNNTMYDNNSVVYSRWLYYTQIIMVFIFVFTMSIFMLNVLIAILTIEYGKISETSLWRVEQAMLVRELMCLYRFMQEEELYDLSWLEFDEKKSNGNLRVQWLHVIPPDNDAFWYTNSKPEDSETAQIRTLEQIQVALEELKTNSGRERKQITQHMDANDSTASFNRQLKDIRRKIDKVSHILHTDDHTQPVGQTTV